MTAFDPPLPDGVYINLPAEAYFRQETRGSSDWGLIDRRLHGWWWASPYNPARKPATKAKAIASGHASHVMLCEGIAAYGSRYLMQPAKEDFADLMVTVDDMKAGLTKEGYGNWPQSWKAADFVAACEVNIPRRPCWTKIWGDFLDGLGDREPITREEDFQLRFLWEMATGEFPGNEPIKKLLTDPSPVMAEVSVLRTVDGIRRRWRFDRMFPRLDMDLKSLANWMGKPLEYAVGEQLGRYRWAIQRQDYWHGRRHMYEMLAEHGEGAIHGGTPEQRKWLLTWPEEHTTWDWLWLVYQRPDGANGVPPVLMPVWEDSFDPVTGNPSYLRQVGEHRLENAIAFYREMLEQFGLDRPWAHVEPLHYTAPAPGRRNLIVLPEYIGKDMPVEDDAYG